MNMNEYWEKYKNRNKSQENFQQSPERPNINPSLDHFSYLQSQINSLEDKYLELQSKLSASSAYESHFSSHSIHYPEKLERLEKSFSFLEQRLTKLEDQNNFFKYENLRMDLIKELNLSENKIFHHFDSELQALNFKLRDVADKGKDTKRNIVRFEDQAIEGKVDQEWQKKIEKIVIVCAEKLKNIEDKTGNLFEGNSIDVLLKTVKKVKNFRISVVKRLDELEEFSKKLCKKFLDIECSSAILSPMAKHQKNESNLSFTHKKVNVDAEKSKKNCEGKRGNNRSVSPVDKKTDKIKVKN